MTNELLSAKPPADVIEELKSFETSTGTPFQTIKDSFYEILVQPYLDAFEIDDRCRQASKILLAQFAEKLSYRTAAMEFKVIDITAIKTFVKEVDQEDPITHEMTKVNEESHRATVYGIFAGIGEDDSLTSKYGILDLWGDACQLLPSIQKDQGYSGTFGLTEYDNYYKLSINEATPLIPATLDVPPIKDMIVNFFTPISVSAAEYNLSEDRNDLKLISGRVQSSRITLNKKGNNMGWITLIDDTSSIDEIKSQEAPKLSVMFLDAPEFATRYATGSQILILCNLDQSEQYGLSSFGQLVIPIIGIPSQIQSHPTARVIPTATDPKPATSTSVQQPAVPTTPEKNPTPPAENSEPTSETDPAPQTQPTPTPSDVTGW